MIEIIIVLFNFNFLRRLVLTRHVSLVVLCKILTKHVWKQGKKKESTKLFFKYQTNRQSTIGEIVIVAHGHQDVEDIVSEPNIIREINVLKTLLAQTS